MEAHLFIAAFIHGFGITFAFPALNEHWDLSLWLRDAFAELLIRTFACIISSLEGVIALRLGLNKRKFAHRVHFHIRRAKVWNTGSRLWLVFAGKCCERACMFFKTVLFVCLVSKGLGLLRSWSVKFVKGRFFLLRRLLYRTATRTITIFIILSTVIAWRAFAKV